MSNSIIQRSFASGELSPSLHSRVDQSKYSTGLKTLRNAYVMRAGGVQNRPGTKFVCEVKDSTKTVRLIPFVFSNDQTYILEFGDLYIRFIKNGAQLGAPYEVATEYLESELMDLQFVQSADVITIVHPSHPPSELRRLGDTSWTFSEISFQPDFQGEAGITLSGGSGGGTSIYMVTAISRLTGEESLPVINDSHISFYVSNSNPAICTSVSHGFSNGQKVAFSTKTAMPEIHGRQFVVANATANTFELQGEDSTNYQAWSVSGFRRVAEVCEAIGQQPSVSAPITVSWNPTVDAKEYNIYREKNGVYGLVGISQTTSFIDTGLTPDTSNKAPEAFNPFPLADQYPSCVSYLQQRLLFGGSNELPETIFASRIGQYKNFTKNSPIQDDDYLEFTIAGRRVNRIKHIIDIGKMVILTDSGEWTCEGNQNGVITPTEINLKQHSYIGSSSRPPLVVGSNALFIQARGGVVRDLGFDYQIDGYRGNDLTSFSSHLVDKYTIQDWDYQQIPHSIVWMVRDDGTVLGLTHVREQQLLGWHRHDFGNDIAERVCCIPNGSEDEVYFVVKRTVNGSTKRYIERLDTRKIIDIVDNIFADCSATYDGRNTGSTTMTLSGGTTWSDEETLTITASASTFSAGDVGNEIHFYDADGGTIIRVRITSYTSGTVVSGKSNVTVPVSLRSVASTSWARAVDQVTGLSHLEGYDVSVVGDRFVVASPLNDSYPVKTISSGTLNLNKCYAVIHVGIPYVTDIETLDVDTAQGETISSKQKNVSHVTGRFEETRGVFIGAQAPSDDALDPLEGLIEMKLRENESLNDSNDLLTGVADLNIQAHWNNNGHVFIRQVDPVPMTLLSVSGEGLFPFKGSA